MSRLGFTYHALSDNALIILKCVAQAFLNVLAVLHRSMLYDVSASQYNRTPAYHHPVHFSCRNKRKKLAVSK